MYCFTSLAGKTICKPDHMKVTVCPSGGNIICVEKKTDVPVRVSQYSISKEADCQYLYIEFEPTDSNQKVREIFYSVKTIQFNPQYSLPDHDHYSAPDIYREYESKGDNHLLTTLSTSTTPTELITSTSEETICIQLTTNAISPGVIVTNSSPNHKYNTCKCPPITLLQQSPNPQQISQPQTTSPPQKISGIQAIAQGQAMSNPQQDPKETPRAKQTQSPPPQSPSPPKAQTNLQIPKNLPFPKNL